MDKFKKFLAEQPENFNVTRGGLLLAVGGYLIYMGIQMLGNTRSGVSSMPMRTTVILMTLMILSGIGVIIYGGVNVYGAWLNDTQKMQSQTEEEQERKDTK